MKVHKPSFSPLMDNVKTSKWHSLSLSIKNTATFRLQWLTILLHYQAQTISTERHRALSNLLFLQERITQNIERPCWMAFHYHVRKPSWSKLKSMPKSSLKDWEGCCRVTSVNKLRNTKIFYDDSVVINSYLVILNGKLYCVLK